MKSNDLVSENDKKIRLRLHQKRSALKRIHEYLDQGKVLVQQNKSIPPRSVFRDLFLLLHILCLQVVQMLTVPRRLNFQRAPPDVDVVRRLATHFFNSMRLFSCKLDNLVQTLYPL